MELTNHFAKVCKICLKKLYKENRGTYMDFKDKVLYVRVFMNLTQMELAEKINVSYTTISRWETGKHAPTKRDAMKFHIFCRMHEIDIQNLKL